jgi:hypothetical protein
MSQFEIIGTPAMRVLKRYVRPSSVYSLRRHSGFGASATVTRTTLSKVARDWAVRNLN